MTEQIEYVVVEKPRRKWYRNPGCVLGLIIWFFVMLLPLFFFILAVEGDITLQHGGDVPDKHEHPLLQIRLIMEIDYRGFGITNSTIQRDGENDICVETNVRYILWQGQGDPATFCDCYTRTEPDEAWTLTGTTMTGCE